jgi:tetratricopeptide (TPR) repeat protein
MAVEQISRRLDDRFRLLTGGARTALPRQQTLRALIDWSYDLLSATERLILRRLSVFTGSWTLEAAEHVCSGTGIEAYDVLDLLSQLVNKSLVIVSETSQPNEMRYRMLETIRQYAREKLLESGEGETIRDSHFGYYQKMAGQARAEFAGPGELTWLVWLGYEWDNIRAAVEWSIERHPQAGLELVNHLGYLFLDSLNNLTDMENWLAALLAQPGNTERSTRRARGLLHWSWYASANREEAVPVQDMIDESISIYEEANDRNGLAHAYLVTALSTEDLDVSGAFCDKALHLFRETGDKFGAGFALLYFGWAMGSHDNDHKRASLEESLAIHRELGFASGIIESSKQYAALEIRLGNFEAAQRRLEEASSLLEKNSSRLGNSITISFDLGDLAYYEEKYDLARKYYEESLSWSAQKGLPYPAAWARARLGYLYTRLGDVDQARSFLRKALTSFHKGGAKISIIFTLEGLASLAVAEGQWERAVLLYACATEQRNAMSEPRPPVEAAAVERDLAHLRDALDDASYRDQFAAGRGLTLEEAVARALEK